MYAVRFICNVSITNRNMSDGEFRKISLPKDLVDRAELLVKDQSLKPGFLSVADLVRTAVHMHITTLETRQTYLKYKDHGKEL